MTFLVSVLIALLIGGLIYYVAGLFLPHPIPILVAILVIVVWLVGGHRAWH